jgi:hypothetical protein
MGLSPSLSLFPLIMVGAAAFNLRAYNIQSTSHRAVNHVLKEEVDTIIGAGTHICTFLTHEYVHCHRRLHRRQSDRGEDSASSRPTASLVPGAIPHQSVQGCLFPPTTLLVSFCSRTMTIDVCGLGGVNTSR